MGSLDLFRVRGTLPLRDGALIFTRNTPFNLGATTASKPQELLY